MPNLIEIPLRGTKQLEEFRLRRTAFIDIYLEPLSQLRNGIANTPMAMDRDERILYALGRLVFEDFTEVVVNCANGLTTGAMKIQRGMYERTVTLVYLDQNPTQIEKFFNYFHIADWKKIRDARQVFPDLISDEFYEQKKREYEATREAYIVPACRDCSSARKKAEKASQKRQEGQETSLEGTINVVAGCTHRRVNHTWSDLDIVSMSEKIE